MTLKSFFFQVLIRLSFKWKQRRKPRPPSPTTSDLLLDSLVPHTPNVAECILDAVNFNPDVWREILSYCEVIEIVRVGMTCRSLAAVVEDNLVWYCALLRICHGKRLPHLLFRIKSLSSVGLRQKAILLARLDRLPHGLRRIPSRYTTTCLSLPVSAVWGISFLPGGEWLVVLCRRAGRDGVMVCRASDPRGQPSKYSRVRGGNLTDMCVFTGDKGDLLMVLRSDRPNRTRLGVYLVDPSESNPAKLKKVKTIGVRSFENFTALGSYVAYGWIDHGHMGPRHLIKVLKFESRRRKLVEHSLIQVEWEVGRHSHSYALRITDFQIVVVVSSTTLVAAYQVPPMASACNLWEPAVAEPFWRFPCGYMRPCSVYLVPSLPAVDAPSVAVFYRDRCLLILPDFDTDPLGVHPTYFSTYKYPREIKYPMLLGPQRAFWDLGHGKVGIGPLPAPLQPAFCDRDGSWDVTGINATEGDLTHLVHPLVYADYHNRRVARAAWDEESGKLALFPKPEFQQGVEMSIFIVDFMH